MYIAGGQYGGQLVRSIRAAIRLSGYQAYNSLALLPFSFYWHYCQSKYIGTIAMLKQFNI